MAGIGFELKNYSRKVELHRLRKPMDMPELSVQVRCCSALYCWLGLPLSVIIPVRQGITGSF